MNNNWNRYKKYNDLFESLSTNQDCLFTEPLENLKTYYNNIKFTTIFNSVIKNKLLNISTLQFIKYWKISLTEFKLLLKYYFKNNSWPKCEICGKEHANYFRQNLRQYCNNTKCTFEISKQLRHSVYKNNPKILELAKEKSKQTCLGKYGLKHYVQTTEFKEKSKQTCLENYGVENPSQSKEIKNKIKQTNLKNYGVDHNFKSDSCKRKREKTFLKKYGTKHITNSLYFKNKSKQTSINNCGEDHHLKTSKGLEKLFRKQRKLKTYIFPSGRIAQVQGYEPQALNYLLSIEKIKEVDILTQFDTGCPKIKREDKIYHPDIYIKSQNRIIEVKSEWTYKNDKTLFDKIKFTLYYYNIDVYIMDHLNNLIRKISYASR